MTTISGLFQPDFCFAIPPYQRAYSWKRENLERLVQDLEEQPPGKPYYLGHFLFEAPDLGRLHVIDGQQRLTTAVIFFSCLIRELRKRFLISPEEFSGTPDLAALHSRYVEDTSGARLETVAYDNTFFRSSIIAGAAEPVTEESPRSQKLILEARDFFAKHFAVPSTTISKLLEWCQTVESAVVTTFTLVGEDAKERAAQIFAYQNDRGIKPTNLELLKAYLMHEIYLQSSNRAELEAIKDVQSDFAEIMKYTERMTLGEDQVLAHHCTAFLCRSDQALSNVALTLKDQLQDSRVSWIKVFCGHLRRSFRQVMEIEKVAEKDCAYADLLFLDAPNCWPLLLKLHHHHRPEEIRRSLRLMEIALFKKEYSHSDYRTNDFHGLARHYSGILESLNRDLEHRAQNGFQSWWTFNESFRACLNGDHHYFPLTRYLLWKWENHLRSAHHSQPVPPDEFLNLYGAPRWGETQDHIMPQNPDGFEHSQEFREKFLHNLGNLVLMNRSKNSWASNALPAEKVGGFLHSPHISHKKVASVIQEKGWDHERIQDRKRQITDFALTYWEALSSDPDLNR